MPVLLLLLASSVLINLFVLIQLVLHGRRGITVGKKIMGLRSVNLGRFDRPGFWRIVLRAITLQACATIVPVVGGVVVLASGVWDREKRGRSILDSVASIWLIDVRHALDPFDAKAMRLST